MTTTKVKNGELVSISTTEVDLQPDDPLYSDVVLVKCSPVSGTIYFGVGNAGGSPVINGATQYGSYTSGSDAFRSVNPGNYNLRAIATGAATFIVSW